MRTFKKKSAIQSLARWYHAELVETNWFIKQKANYIYNNPMKDKIVALPEDYYFSSARHWQYIFQ